MKALERDRVADRVVERLKQEIRSGVFARELPSCRRLAAQLEVSPPTIMAALGKLVREGWLAPGAPRRPYRIVRTGLAEDNGGQRLLLLSPRPLNTYAEYTRILAERILVYCASKGWEVQVRVADYLTRRFSQRAGDELVRTHRPTRIVALIGTPEVARWAVKLGVPTLFCGGSADGAGVTVLGVSLSKSLRVLLRSLTDAECLHLCLPLCGFPEEFATTLRQACQEEFSARGITFVPGYHIPFRPSESPEEVRAAVTPVLDSRPPEGFVFLSRNHFLAVQHLLHACYRKSPSLPRLAFLADIEGADWLEPPPAVFVYPQAGLWQAARTWLLNPHAERFRGGPLRMSAILRPSGRATHPMPPRDHRSG